MSFYQQRTSPPRYERRAERPANGIIVPVGYYPPSAYDDRKARDYPSPRASNDRVGKSSTTLAVEERYDKNGRLISTYRDPSFSTAPKRRSSLNGAASPRFQEPRSARTAVLSQSRDIPANSSRPVERYKDGNYYSDDDYYATPYSSTSAYSHRHSLSIDEARRSRDDDLDHPESTRRSLDRSDRVERTGYHLSGPNPKTSDASYTTSRDASYYDTSARRDRRASDLGSRERPNGLALDTYKQSRSGGREYGPPSSFRGVARNSSLKEQPLRSPISPRGARAYPDDDDDDPDPDDYIVRRRHRSTKSESIDRPVTTSTTRQDINGRYADPGLESRGFGLVRPSPQTTADRDDAVDKRKILPAGMLPGRASEEPREAGRRKSPPTNDRDIIPMPEFDPDALRLRQEDNIRSRDRDTDRNRVSNERRERKDYNDRLDERDEEDQPHDPPRTQRKSRREDLEHVAGTTAVLGGAALVVGEYARRHTEPRSDESDKPKTRKQSPPEDKDDDSATPAEKSNGPLLREKYNNPGEMKRASPPPKEAAAVPEPDHDEVDAEDDYMARVQKEMERVKQAKAGAKGKGKARDVEDDGERSPPPIGYQPPKVEDHEGRTPTPTTLGNSMAVTPYAALDGQTGLVDEPNGYGDDDDDRVKIVEPTQEKDKPKGILRKPTAKFPEYPPEAPVAVAPHRDSPVPGAPADALTTIIPRDYVNPAALREAGERFYEDQEGDNVIVLRVVPRGDVDKWIERTKEIRDRRRRGGGRGDEKNSDEDDKKARARRDKERAEEDGDEKHSSRRSRHRDDNDKDEDDNGERRHRRHRDDDDKDEDENGERRHRRHHRRRRRGDGNGSDD